MNNYDEWKLENGDDYDDRMGMHRRGPSSLPPAGGGRCACGVETTRSVAGIGWQCQNCGESELMRIFGTEIAEQTRRERNDELFLRYVRRA